MKLFDPIRDALSTSTSKINLVQPQTSKVIINPPTATGVPVGVTLVDTTAGTDSTTQYLW